MAHDDPRLFGLDIGTVFLAVFGAFGRAFIVAGAFLGRGVPALMAMAVAVVTAFMLTVSTHGFAETRARPFTPEQLHEQSTWVIKGTVLEIATIAGFAVAFPTRAGVDTVVKGRWPRNGIAFQHKHPGLSVIFEQEFNMPEVGQTGTFHVQDRNGTLLLIGYIRDADPAHQAAERMAAGGHRFPTAGDERRASEILGIAASWWLRNRGLLAEESIRVAGP